MKRRYVHTKTNGEHQGINFEIMQDGKIKLNNDDGKKEEFDEITIPASLIFKLQTILVATRKVVWMEASDVPPSEVSNG